MRRRGLARGLGLFSVLFALSACEASVEYVVLVDVESQIDLAFVDVVAVPDGHPAVESETGVTATVAELETSPLRVVVSLTEPGPVQVRILGQAPDGTTVATAVRCYDVTEKPTTDRVLLVTGLADDVDRDGWPTDPMSACVAPGPTPCAAFACPATSADCDDGDPTFNPGGSDLCGLDRSCDGVEGPCVDVDMDGVFECPPGVVDPTCDCDDGDPLVFPAAEDVCSDGVDQNCDGSDARCDRDMDGADEVVDCDDMDPSRYPGAPEVCTPEGGTPVDENCNGIVDELPDCGPNDRDGDGVASCLLSPPPVPCDCDDCDAGRAPLRAEICGDGIDQDCDGVDPACPASDGDGDGFVDAAMGGVDCDDDNPLAHPGAIENCRTGESESCGTAPSDCALDTDGDGWIEPSECERMDVAIAPDVPEVCDGIDNDCDGIVDEVGIASSPTMDEGCVLDPTRMSSTSIDHLTDTLNCGGCGIRCDVPSETDSCRSGSCVCSTSDDGSACPMGELCCDTDRRQGCYDLSSSFEACGSCDVGCDETTASACVAGRCVCGASGECVAPNQCCDSRDGHRCVNFDNDRNNCGGCGVRCGRDEQCREGSCTCGSDVGGYGDGAVCTGEDQCCPSMARCKKHGC